MAVAVVTLAITVVLALLPSLLRQGVGSVEAQVAVALPDAIRVELRRLAVSGFDALAGQIPEAGAASEGFRLVAPREGGRARALDYLPPSFDAVQEADQYFLVECWRLPDEPFRFRAGKACLPLEVCVSWPWRIPGAATPSEARNRNRVWFVVSINR